ncbi:MAG: hypothetical protein WD928_01025 [Gammaproteobacteria bacterium]
MKRSSRKRSGIVVCLLLLGIVSPHAQAEVTSIADWPCSTWTARRVEGVRADPPQMWLAGFMTGLATALRVDVLAITDAPAMFAWMDEFCAEHPDEVLSTGAGILFNELLARLPTSRPYLSAH